MIHAILSSGHLLRYDKEGWSIQLLDWGKEPSLDAFLSLVETTNIDHLWVMGDVPIVPNRAFFLAAVPIWDMFPSWNIDPTIAADAQIEPLLVSITAFRVPKGGRKKCVVNFVEQLPWSFNEDLTPKILLTTILYIEKALGVPMSAGPTAVGMSLLHLCNEAHPEWLRAPSNLDDAPWREAIHDVQRDLALTVAERATGQYLVKYDKNSAYLRACVAASFGSGLLMHQFHGQGVDEKKVGLWKVTVLRNPVLRSALLFEIYKEASGWLTAPMIKLMRDSGYHLDITEGYVYSEKHGTLSLWAQKIWDARISFRTDSTKWKSRAGRENAEAAMKDIATKSVGVLSSEKVRGTWKYRPDLHAQAMSTHVATMFYNMDKVFNMCGKTPVILYMDALYYVVDSLEEKVLGLDIDPNKLGAYKEEWRIPMSQAIAILESSLGMSAKLGAMNDLAYGYDGDGDE